MSLVINPLTPNDPYSGRTAPLTSKVAFYIFIQQIQVPNILNIVYTLRFFFSSKCSLFHNSNLFGSCIIHILYTGCAKIKKNNSGAKRLNKHTRYSNSFCFCFCERPSRCVLSNLYNILCTVNTEQTSRQDAIITVR